MNSGINEPRALITGASRRIGATLCRHLHGQGWRIALHYNSSETEARALADELNGVWQNSCDLHCADLSTREGCAQLASEVATPEGLQLLVNNASQYYPTPLEGNIEADWEDLMNTNLRAPLRLCLALADSLRQGQGSIVNIVDAHCRNPQPGYALYDLSKNALSSLTRSLALELAPDIRVNAIAPGAILWPEEGMPATAGTAAEQDSPETALLADLPLQRLGNEADIARALSYLASDAPYVTGQVLYVDGGRSLV